MSDTSDTFSGELAGAVRGLVSTACGLRNRVKEYLQNKDVPPDAIDAEFLLEDGETAADASDHEAWPYRMP